MFNWKRPRDMAISEPTEEQIWKVIEDYDPRYRTPIHDRLAWHQEMLEGRNIYENVFARSSRMNSFESELPSGFDPPDWVISLNLRHSNEAPLKPNVDRLISGNQNILLPASDDVATAGIVNLLGYHILQCQAEDWDPRSMFGTPLAPVSKYITWARYHLRTHHSVLKKAGVYHAIYASLFDYSRLPFTWIRSIAEHWDKNTNTCWIGVNELTMTLADIQNIAGLPILGTPYEECIPPDHELFERKDIEGNRKGVFVYPTTLHRALDHYKNLFGSPKGRRKRRDAISLDTWAESFVKRDVCSFQYARLSDPFDIKADTIETSFRDWFEPEGGMNARHVLLDQDDDLSLVAFIATWLCYFVFPGKNRQFRPSTLLMASLISKGERIALAPATLAYLYHGLGQVSAMTDSRKYDVEAPWHFLHGWVHAHVSGGFSCPEIPQFFKENHYPTIMQLNNATSAAGVHQIRTFMFAPEHITERFQIIHESQMQSLPAQSFGQYFEDVLIKGNIPLFLSRPTYRILAEHFIAIRPSWLCYRRHESITLEEYHPNRVARQFGFVQATPSYGLPRIPNVDNVRSLGTLPLSARLNVMSQAWTFMLRLGTGSRFYIASRGTQTGVSHFWLKWIRHTFSSFLEKGFNTYSKKLKKSVNAIHVPLTGETSERGGQFKRTLIHPPMQKSQQPHTQSRHDPKRGRSDTSSSEYQTTQDERHKGFERIESSENTSGYSLNDRDKATTSSSTHMLKLPTAPEQPILLRSQESLESQGWPEESKTMWPIAFGEDQSFNEAAEGEDATNIINQNLPVPASELELSCFVSQIEVRKTSSSRSHLGRSQNLAVVALRELLLSIDAEALPEISIFREEANSLLNYAAVTGVEVKELQKWESALREVELRLYLIQSTHYDVSLKRKEAAGVAFKEASEKAELVHKELQNKIRSVKEREAKISETEIEASAISTELEELQLKMQYLLQRKERVSQISAKLKRDNSQEEAEIPELKQKLSILKLELEMASQTLQAAQERYQSEFTRIDEAIASIKEVQFKYM